MKRTDRVNLQKRIDRKRLDSSPMTRIAYTIVRKLFLTARPLRHPLGDDEQTRGSTPAGGIRRFLHFRAADALMSAIRFMVRTLRLRDALHEWITHLAAASNLDTEYPVGVATTSGPEDFTGINLVGFLGGELGLGESARSTLRATRSAGIKVAGFAYKYGCDSRWTEMYDCDFVDEQRFAVNLFHLNPDHLRSAYYILGKEFFARRYNIDYCVWEQVPFPEDWISSLELVDEVWTASSFCRGLIAQATSKPVYRIPHTVSPVVDEGIDRKALGLPEKGFLFLAMADFLSTPERKNPLGCLEAYCRGPASRADDVYFILKTMNSHLRPDVMRRIQSYSERRSSIIILDGALDRREVNALMQCCDCFVSLHRAEGFGLPLAESMYLGKPVIATGWSGNTDFMNRENSLLVNYTLTELERDAGPYRKGHTWADPSLDHAAELMDRAVADRESAASVGARGMEHIQRHFSPPAVGNLLRRQLERIRANLNNPAKDPEEYGR